MKFLLKTIVLFTLISCSKVNKTNGQIKFLIRENDSLKSILSEINNKYVFDSISIREITNRNNTKKINSIYKTEIVVIGYSENPYFIKYDSLVDEKRVKPDTLKQIKGRYQLNILLDKKTTPINIDMKIKNKYGKSQEGVLRDLIKIKP